MNLRSARSGERLLKARIRARGSRWRWSAPATRLGRR